MSENNENWFTRATTFVGLAAFAGVIVFVTTQVNSLGYAHIKYADSLHMLQAKMTNNSCDDLKDAGLECNIENMKAAANGDPNVVLKMATKVETDSLKKLQEEVDKTIAEAKDLIPLPSH